MTQPEISGISPLFIVRDVPKALSFYRDQLGFEITFQGPSEDDIFFGIVQRGAAMIMFKAVGVEPVPNYTRDVKKGIARWDAYLHVRDPDALAAEFASRDLEFLEPLKDTMTACAVSNSRMRMAMSCFLVDPGHEASILSGRAFISCRQRRPTLKPRVKRSGTLGNGNERWVRP